MQQPGDGALARIRKYVAGEWYCGPVERALAALGAAVVRWRATFIRTPRNRAATPSAFDLELTSQTRSLAVRHDRLRRSFATAAYTLLLALWAVFLWMVLVYGNLIHKLLGADAQKAFTRSWGIGVGLVQLQDARGVLVSIAETVAALLLLESLWLVPNGAWLERAMDEAAVLGTLYGSLAVSLLHRLRTYARFNKAVS